MPGGHFLMVNEMIHNGFCNVKYAKMIEKAHVRLIPLDETKNTLEAVGFENVKIFTKVESPWNAILEKKP